MRDGEMVMDVIGEMDTTVRSLVNAGLTEIADRLELAAADLRAASRWLLDKGGASSDDGLAGATPYLEMFGTTIGGWLLGESALAAKRRLAESTGADRRPFLEAKVATAGFYARQLLPRVHGLLPAVTAGADSVYAVPEADLG